MHTVLKAAGSLAAGLAAFVVVGVAVTEALDPYVWPSLLLGAPAGLVAGVLAVAFAHLGLTAWEERRETGRASAETRRRFRTAVGAAVGFVAGGGLATAAVWSLAVGLATAVLTVGAPVGLLGAVIGGYLAYRGRGGDRRPPRSTTQ